MTMRQFDVFKDRQGDLYVVLQNDLLEPMETVVVAPVVERDSAIPIRKLTPEVEIDGNRYLVMTAGVVTIPARPLKKQASIASLSGERDAILDAVNLIYWGI